MTTDASPRRLWTTLGPVFFFALATVVQTWPLATSPARLAREDADAQLNAWIVSWIAHQLPRDPVHLFDANIFHPERHVLAFSEPLVPPGVLAIAPRALGASAVLTYNLLLMAGFLLTGLAGYVVGTRLSGDRLGGLLAGSLVAFGPHTLARLAHLQAQWLVTLPLCLLALDSVIRTRAWGPALRLGVWVALLAVTSGYGLALAFVAALAAWLARACEWWRDWRSLVPRLAAGALVSAVLAFPVLLPYWQVFEEQGLRRDAREAASLAALPSSFVATPSRLHFTLWSHRFDRPQGGTYFPGFAALALAALGLVLDAGWKQPRSRMLVAVALAGGTVALGPATPLFGLLQLVFPPMRGLRDPSRFGALVILGVGLLAAAGLAAVRRRLRGGLRLCLPLVIVALAHAEVLCAPYAFAPYAGLSPIYARLALEPGRTALAEFPFHAGEGDHLNSPYVLASTVHWTPLVNGYSGFAPRSFEERAETLRHFPDPEAVAELRRIGVSHVIVHPDDYRMPRRSRVLEFLETSGDFAWIATGPAGERLYRLTGAPRSVTGATRRGRAASGGGPE